MSCMPCDNPWNEKLEVFKLAQPHLPCSQPDDAAEVRSRHAGKAPQPCYG